MILVRQIARPMLASPFLVGGVDALRHPATTSAVSAGPARQVAARIPKAAGLDADAAVRINGGVMTAAAALLATGRMPRLASLALLVTVVPPLLERAADLKDDKDTDPQELAERRMRFVGSLGVVGGLLIAAVDTAGRPSLRRRAEHASRLARRELAHSRREAKLAAKAHLA